MPDRTKPLRPLLFLAGIISLLTLQLSCKHEIDNLDSYKQVCFETEVHRILMPCSTIGCHNSGGEGGLLLVDYQSIRDAVKPKDPYNSQLYLAITGKKFTQLMPPHDVLSKDERITIKMWIMQGALADLDPTCAPICVETGKITYTTHISANMAQNCVPCHRTGNAQKDVILDNYESVKSYALNGKLVGTMKAINGYQQMPPGGRLPDCPINQVINWIAQGTPEK